MPNKRALVVDDEALIRWSVSDATVVLMTAFGTPEIVARAHELGVAGVLNKPFELSELARLVQGAAEL